MQSDLNSINGIELVQPKHLFMVAHGQGRVWSPREFATTHLDCLRPHEKAFFRDQLMSLSDVVPQGMDVPQVRSAGIPQIGEYRRVLRSGARSAYDPVSKVQFKGCRPIATAAFPSWEVGDDFELHIKTIPFGVLTDENVMRELMAFTFLKANNLLAPHTPLAVFQYEKDCCCVVFNVKSPLRAEALIDDFLLRSHDILRLNERAFELPNREVGLHTSDAEGYRDQKIQYLLAMQFAGGFRGILNSNIGNDVVHDGAFLGICDLDTFTLEPVPTTANDSNWERFITRCVLEAIKSSLPLLVWLDIADKSSLTGALAECFSAKSVFFKQYRCELINRSTRTGASETKMNRLVEKALRMPMSTALLEELIPNAITFGSFKKDSFYTPHH
jgi:hypothetical protein